MEATHFVVIYLFCLGFYCVLTDKNLIKISMGFVIMEASVLLFLISLASFPGGRPPIIVEGILASMVDPLPQALCLTAIVIGAGTTGFMLSLIIRLFRHSGTVRIDRIGRTEQ